MGQHSSLSPDSKPFVLTEEVGVATTLKEDTERWEDDREDDLDDVGAGWGSAIEERGVYAFWTRVCRWISGRALQEMRTY